MTATRINLPPRGVFRGVNFMTPHVIAYFKLNKDGYVAYVELSKGTGFENDTIYGVTVRRANGAHFEDNSSRMFNSIAEAIQYINNNLKEVPR